jgi:hypothetical protein
VSATWQAGILTLARHALKAAPAPTLAERQNGCLTWRHGTRNQPNMAQDHRLYTEFQRLVGPSAVHAVRQARKLARSWANPELKPWDRSFRNWIAEAKSLGRDPNDVGDERWGDARPGTEAHYLPLIDQQSVVMEMGPGSGRYTRHLLPRCREMVLVDYSKFVCEWVQEYFAGKGTFRVVLAKDYALGAIADGSIDAVVANGVFEHLYLEAFYQYLVTFERVMKPGARGCLNFNNIASDGGFEHFETKLPQGMDERCIFRFYHPETVRELCRRAGLEVERLSTSEHRFAFLTFKKPG